jgi:hypothetical protein
MAAESELKLTISAIDRASEVIRKVQGGYQQLLTGLDKMNAKAVAVRQAMSQWGELEGLTRRIAMGIMAIGAAMGAVAWKAGQMAAEEERFQLALATLWGRERAQQLIQWATEFAQRYGFYIEDVKSAMQALSGVALRTGVDLRDALLIAGRLAAATGRPITEMAEAVMMALQGWPRALRHAAMGLVDVKEIQELTTQAMMRQQKEMEKAGATGEAMGAMIAGGMEEVELSADEANRIIQNLLQQTARLQPVLQVQANTITAAWERMRSQIREAWEELGFALAPYLIRFMQLFRQFFENLMRWITQNRPALETLGNAIFGIANTVMRMVVWLGNFFAQHQWLTRLVASWGPYIAAITLVVATLGNAFIWVMRLIEAVRALGIVSTITGAAMKALGIGGAAAGAGAGAGVGAAAGGVLGGIAAGFGMVAGAAALGAGAAYLGYYLGTRRELGPYWRAQREVAEYQASLWAMSAEERRRRLWGLPPRQYATPVVVQGDIMTRDWADAQMLQRMQNEFGYGGVY